MMHIAVLVQTKDKDIDLLVVSGHADQQEENDIYQLVCAEVSAISVGTLNAIDEMCPDSCDIQMEDGYVSIKVRKSNDVLQTVLKTMEIQLKTVEFSNKDYIRVEKVEV